MKARGRLSGARLAVWPEALAELKRERRKVINLALGLGLIVAFVNLPVFPSYERGLVTGAVLTGFAWALAWAMWVTSGLSLRLNGAWAEDATNDELRGHARVFGVVPSLKFRGYDVDAVAVSRAGVLAVETKWMLRPNEGSLQQFADQAAQRGRTLRLSMKGQGITEQSFVPLLVLWGPGSEGVNRHIERTPLGPVRVTSGRELAQLIDGLPQRHIGPDFAEELLNELGELARERDGNHPEPGFVVRRLSRVK